MKEKNRKEGREGRYRERKETEGQRQRKTQKEAETDKEEGKRESLSNARQNSSVIQECFVVLSLQMKKGKRGVNSKSLISDRTELPT